MANSENVVRNLSIFINDRQVVNSLTGITREVRFTRNALNQLNQSSETYNEDLARLQSHLRDVTDRQSEMRNEINGTTGVLDRLHRALGPVATGMLAAFSVQGVISGFVGGIKDAWNTVVEFNQGQADLAAVLGTTRFGVRNLTADAIKLGSATAYSATEVTELQTELARLGKTEKEIRSMTRAVLDSATALESGLGEAAELVGGQLNSYQESASQAQKYSDIMANSVNISATSFESLSTALPKVSAVAFQSDVSFEKLNATLGVLADQNIAAETAGTGFRNILLTSAEAGIPYEQMLEKIKGSTNQTAAATEMFGKENATVAVILANSTQKINLNTKALENSAGSAEKLAIEKMNSIKGATEEFSGAWEGFILSLENGDGPIAKVAKSIIQLGTAFISALTPMRRMSDEIREEQVQLNVLVSKITSTNVSNEERKRLIIQLNEQYPEFIGNIDSENISNEELKKQLIKVNEQYRERILLQKQVERRDDAQKSFEGVTGAAEAYKLQFAETLAEIATDNKINFTVDYGNIEKSARQLLKTLENRDIGGGFFGDQDKIEKFLKNIKAMESTVTLTNKEYKKQEDILKNVQKATGQQTESEKERAKLLAEEAAQMKALRIEAEKLGMKNSATAPDIEVKKWVAAYKARQKYSGMTEAEKKQAEKDRKAAEKLAAQDEKAAEKAAADYIHRQKELAKANLEYYLATHTSKLDAEKQLTQELVDEETKRLSGIKEAKLKALEVETGSSDLVIGYKQLEHISLNAMDIQYLTGKKNLEMEFLKSTGLLKKEYNDQQKTLLAEQLKADNELAVAEATTQAEVDALLRQQQYDQEVEDYKKMLADKKITLDEFTRFKAALDKKQAEFERLQRIQSVENQLNELSRLTEALVSIFGQNKAMASAQAAINGALAVTEILKTPSIFPEPFASISRGVQIAGAVVKTAKSIKEINAAKVPQARGFFDGGFTPKEGIYKDSQGDVAGVVHTNEWVAPAYMTQNPKYANVIGWLENERIRNNGHANGGFVSDTPPVPGTSGTAADDDTRAMLRALLFRLENPVAPNLIVGYENLKDINKMNDELSQSNSFGKLNA